MTDAVNENVVVLARHLRKVYRRGAEPIVAVDDVSLAFGAGEFVAIVGPSGAGKTTLLQLLGAMDTPTSGELVIAGRDVARLSDGELTRLRRERIGFVFQHFGLLPTLTVAENVALPASLATKGNRARVGELLARVGLEHRQNHRPAELSGGEMQRAAIARALVNNPVLLLADEPTGNLDSTTGAAITALLSELRQQGLTVVVVTHNDALANAADRRLVLRDGRITS